MSKYPLISLFTACIKSWFASRATKTAILPALVLLLPGLSFASSMNYPTAVYVKTSESDALIAISGECTVDECDIRIKDGSKWEVIRTARKGSFSIFVRKPPGTYTVNMQRCTLTTTPYGYSYRAWCSGGDFQKNVTVVPVPAKPQTTVPSTATGSFSVKVAAAVSNASYYEIYARAVGAGWSSGVRVQGTSSVSQSKPSGSYEYAAKACNAGGGCSVLGPVRRVDVAHKPGAPDLWIDKPRTNDGNFTVGWDPTSGRVTGYEFIWPVGDNYDESKRRVSQIGLPTGTYTYKVRALNKVGNFTNPSSWKMLEVTVSEPKEKPVLTVDAISSDGLYTVNWTDTSITSYYVLEEKVNGNPSDPVGWNILHKEDFDGLPDLSFKFEAGAIGAAARKLSNTYHYRVKACNAAGCNPAYSTVATIDVARDLEVAPTFTEVPRSHTDGEFSLEWSDVEGADYYLLERSDLPEPERISGAYKPINELAEGTYTYQISACRKVGSFENCVSAEEPASVTVALPTSPVMQDATTPIESGLGNFTIRWDPTENTRQYLLEERVAGCTLSDSQCWQQIAAIPHTTTSFTFRDENARGNGSYLYRVYAENRLDTSVAPSAEKRVRVALAPNAPTGLGILDGAGDGVFIVDWDDAEGEFTEYWLERTSSDGTEIVKGLTESRHEQVLEQEGTYTYVVKACQISDGFANCAEADEKLNLSVAKPAESPRLEKPTESETGIYTLAWGEGAIPADTVYYQLEEKLEGGGWVTQVKDRTTTFEVPSEGASRRANGTYHYRLSACNSFGCAEPSQLSVDVALKPSKPTDLNLTVNDEDRSIVLSWQVPKDSRVTGYRVYYTVDGGDPVELEAEPGLTAVSPPLGDGEYMFYVEALNTVGGYTSNSDAGHIPEPVSKPSGKVILSGPSTSASAAFNLEWQSLAGAEYHELEQKTADGSGWKKTEPQPSIMPHRIEVPSSNTYYYRARACNRFGCSEDSEETVKTVTVAIRPRSPATITVPEKSDVKPIIEWAVSTDEADTYQLDRAVHGTDDWHRVYAGPDTAFRHLQPLSENKYIYRVQSCKTVGDYTSCAADEDGEKWRISDPVQIIDVPEAPPYLVLPALTDGHFTIEWGEAVGAPTSYELQEKENSGDWREEPVYKGLALETAHSVTGEFYSYRVRACRELDGYELCSSPWTSASTTVRAAAPEAIPSLTAPETDTDGNYSLTWKSIENATRYTVEEYDQTTSTWATLMEIAEDAALTDPVTAGIENQPNGSHLHRVAACNARGCAGASNVVRTIVAVAPPRPTEISAPAESYGNVSVNWKGSGGDVSHYEIQRSLDKVNWAEVWRGTGNAGQDQVENKGTYFYSVRACNLVADFKSCSDLAEPYAEVAVVGQGEAGGVDKPVAYSGEPLATGADPLNDVITDDPYYGSIKGTSSVGSDGSFNYRTPIEVPPGINGIQPELSITYNSNRQNGLLGWGWALDGLSVIRRCKADLVRDGYISGINTGDDYRYCLDGRRLIETASGHFRTEEESFLRVRKFSNYWEITANDGTVSRYGYNEDARREDGEGESYAWYLDQKKDIHGNSFDVSYLKDGDRGTHLPDSISYGVNVVSFGYQWRTDKIGKYIAGSYELTEKRLEYIRVKSGTEVARMYWFGYTSSGDKAANSRLSSVTRCRGPWRPGDQACDDTLTAEWSGSIYTLGGMSSSVINAIDTAASKAPSNSKLRLYIDIDGDGLVEPLYAPTSESKWLTVGKAKPYGTSWPNYTDEEVYSEPEYLAADINGDGFSDVVKIWPEVNGVRVYLNGANTAGDREIDSGDAAAYRVVSSAVSFDAELERQVVLGYGPNGERYEAERTRRRFARTVRLIDMTGDGLLDLVRLPYTCPEPMVRCKWVGSESGPTDISVAVNSGAGFSAFQEWYDLASYEGTLQDRMGGYTREFDFQFADLNGDGLIDLRVAGAEPGLRPTFKVYAGINQRGLGDTLGLEFHPLFHGYYDETWGEIAGMTGDFNGDGHSDFVRMPYRQTYEGAEDIEEKITVTLGRGLNTINADQAFGDSHVALEGHSFVFRCGNRRFISEKDQCRRTVFDYNSDGLDDILEIGYRASLVCGPEEEENRCDVAKYTVSGVEGNLYLSRGASSNGKVTFAAPVRYLKQSDLGGSVVTMTEYELSLLLQAMDYNNDGFPEPHYTLRSELKPILPYSVRSKAGVTRTLYATLASDTVYRVLAGKDVEADADNGVKHQHRMSPKRYGVYEMIQLRNPRGDGGSLVSKYKYYDAKTHRGGFGDLGFGRVEKIEYGPMDQEAIKTTSWYHQKVDETSGYKLSGQLKRRLVEVSSKQGEATQTLSDTRNRWKVRLYKDDIDSGKDSPHYFPYVYESSKEQWDLDGTKIATSRTQNHRITARSHSALSEASLATILTATAGAANDNDYHSDGVLLYTETATKDESASNASVQVRAARNSNIQAKGKRRGLVGTRQQYAWSGNSIGSVSDSSLAVRTTGYTYRADGSLATETIEPNAALADQLKRTKTYTYNSYGSVSSVAESWANAANNGLTFSSRTTTIDESYDADGNRTIVTTQPLIGSETTVYDAAFGVPVKHIDVNGLTTTTDYDELGRVKRVNHPDQTVTEVAYRQCNACFDHNGYAAWYAQSKTTGAVAERSYFDNKDRPVGTRSRGFDGSFVYTWRKYDLRGNLTHSSAPFYQWDSQQITRYAYDRLGRVIQTTYPDGSISSRNYEGLTLTSTNREGQVQVQKKNAAGWVMSSTDNAGTPVDYTYSHWGDLQTTVVNNNPLTKVSMTYDIRGRKLTLQDPDAGLIIYSYNPLGLLASEIDAKGQETRYSYDRLGRQIGRVDDAGGSAPRTQNWVYDSKSNGMGKLGVVLGDTTDGTHYREDYSYSALSRPINISTQYDGKTYTVSHHYDGYGRPLATTYPTGYQTAQIYNDYGHLEQVVATATKQPLWVAGEANARGQVTEFTLGDGTVTTRDYNETSGFIDSIRAERSGTLLQSHSYAFDPIGNLRERRDELYGVTQSFCYDNLNRLTAARFDSCSNADDDYTYDVLGNIQSKLYVGNYEYDTSRAGPHAVTAANGLDYHYDVNGNLMEARNAEGDVVRQVGYSSFNKPTWIQNESHWTKITYGPDKARVKRQDSTGRTTYYIGGLFEATTHGGTTRYVHHIGDFALYVENLGLEEDRYHQYLHRDHIGSVVARTTDKDAQADWLGYEPWGNQLLVTWDSGFQVHHDPGAAATRGFTDHEHLDPVGLIHMNGRVYDPELGRFLSPDPLVQAPYNSQSYNRYSYVFNNPLSFVDPTGYSSVDHHEEVRVIGSSGSGGDDTDVYVGNWGTYNQGGSNGNSNAVSTYGMNTFFYPVDPSQLYESVAFEMQVSAHLINWQNGVFYPFVSGEGSGYRFSGGAQAQENEGNGTLEFGESLWDNFTNLRLSADVGAAFGGLGANLSASRELDGDNPSVRVAWASGLGAFGGAFLEGSPLTVGELDNLTQSASFSVGKGLAGKISIEWGPNGFRLTTGVGGGLGLKANIVDFGYSKEL